MLLEMEFLGNPTPPLDFSHSSFNNPFLVFFLETSLMWPLNVFKPQESRCMVGPMDESRPRVLPKPVWVFIFCMWMCVYVCPEVCLCMCMRVDAGYLSQSSSTFLFFETKSLSEPEAHSFS